MAAPGTVTKGITQSRQPISGDSQMISKLRSLAAKYPGVIRDEMVKEMEKVVKLAVDKYVPIDTGALSRSGRTIKFPITKSAIKVGARFGRGKSNAYALVVHEHPSMMDPPSWIAGKVKFKPPRGPKYLHRALMSSMPGMDRRIAVRVDRVIQG